jgi:ABC-type nitrate/sulfonate/bicarbonate transport system substrate-binding protein
MLAAFAVLRAAAPAATPAAAPDVVRIETSDYDLTSEPYYGEAAGIFARYGISLHFAHAVEGGANMIRDLAAGNADVGFSNLISIAVQIQHGAPIVPIAPAALHDHAALINALVVAPDAPFTSGKDLNGKSISSPSGPGSAGALAPAVWIDATGGDSKTVKFVTGIQPLDVPAALADGRIAAAEIGDPALTILRKRGAIKVLAEPFSSFDVDRFLLGGYVAAKTWVQAHPDVAHRFVLAMRETARWSNAHRTETAANLATRLKLAPDVLAAMSRTTFAESFEPETIQPPLDVAAKYGLIAPMKAADLLREVPR